MDTQHVVVVGAGISGLVTAYELSRQGVKVTVLEGEQRIGGRIYTVREPFQQGQISEAGAGRIPSHHSRTLGYIRKFNLKTVSFLPQSGLYSNFLNGRLVREQSPRHTPLAVYGDDFTEWEQTLDMRSLESHYLIEPWSEAGDLRDPFNIPESAHRFDRLSFSELIRAQGASKSALNAILFDMYEPDYKSHVSALFAMRNLGLLQNMTDLFRIEGGNDLLPQAIAAELPDGVCFGALVQEVRQNGEQVTVAYRCNGESLTLTADKVVMAVPPPIVRSISFKPELCEAKATALAAWEPMAPVRISIQFKRRFWLEQGLNGFVRTDMPAGIWDLTHNQAGEYGILSFYVRGKQTQDFLADSNEEARLNWLCDYLSKVFPEAGPLRDLVVGQHALFWGLQTWARGGYNTLPTGTMLHAVQHTGLAEDRIHFAGAHTSAWCVWIEGAVDAAWRVCQEITGTNVGA